MQTVFTERLNMHLNMHFSQIWYRHLLWGFHIIPVSIQVKNSKAQVTQPFLYIQDPHKVWDLHVYVFERFEEGSKMCSRILCRIQRPHFYRDPNDILQTHTVGVPEMQCKILAEFLKIQQIIGHFEFLTRTTL